MLILGMDTGGTYTDAVIVDPPTRKVLEKVKEFTTHDDLSQCIRACMRRLDARLLQDTSMICLSTTLATNAVVEGDGGRVGLLLMGKRPDGRLPAAVWRLVDGLMDIKGREVQAVDPAQVRDALAEFGGYVDAVAVSGFASVRNPAHELAVKDIVQKESSLPVVCAHELSSDLGHYDRTVTAVINAGLIPKIEALVQAVRACATEYGLTAPVMVVKGDGSLIRDEAAVSRPIETILSGPAASIVGGLYLSGAPDALILDMGGTTTDLAAAVAGRVRTNNRGATVGGWRTMVRAAEIATYGIGGDSRVTLDADGKLTVEPRRVEPLCIAATRDPEMGERLREYAGLPANDLSLAAHGVFYRLRKESTIPASKMEQAVVEILRAGPRSVACIAASLVVSISQIPVDDMVRRGIVTPISLTPTDILHASGEIDIWAAAASSAGAAIFAKKMGLGMGEFLREARRVVTEKVAGACVEAAVEFSGSVDAKHGPTLRNLVRYALDCNANPLLGASFRLKQPIVAVGAPVASWLPEVAGAFGTELIIPPDAEVANAVGAAVGQIRVSFEALVRPDKERGVFSAHAPGCRRDFDSRQEAEEWALSATRRHALERVEQWGGVDASLFEEMSPCHFQDPDGPTIYVETRIAVEAVANPSGIRGEL